MSERVPMEFQWVRESPHWSLRKMPLEVLQKPYKEPLELEAKVRELRERLAWIERHLEDFGASACPGCLGSGYGPDIHRPDCWLKREIDELD